MCVEPDDPRVVRFNTIRGIVGGVSLVTHTIKSGIEREFPGLIDVVSDPERWISDLASWMGAGAERMERHKIYLDVVEAPLVFGASTLRLRCPSDTPHSLFVLNAGFLAIVRHTLATSQSSGIEIDELRMLIRDIRYDTFRLRQKPSRPSPLPPAMISGVAWLFTHELAHALRGSVVSPDYLSHIPLWCRSRVADEINADVVGLLLLCHRVTATPAAGSQAPRLAQIFRGIELFLRGLSLLEAVKSGRPIALGLEPDVFDYGGPSPGLRWKHIMKQRQLFADRGLIDEPHGDLFSNWDRTVDSIFDDGGITS